MGGFVAVLAVVALLYAVVDRGGDHVQPSSVAAHPGRVVGVGHDGRLVVLSAGDGHVVRTLATDAVASGGLAVAPDGKTVYFVRSTASACGNVMITDIASVPMAGGRTRVIATNVRYPAVSPDGRSLAFTGIPGCSDAGNALLVRDLPGASADQPYDRRWDGAPPAYADGSVIGGLSWSPDSRHLGFVWTVPAGTSHLTLSYPSVLDTTTATSLADARQVFLDPMFGWYGYRGETDSLLAVQPVPGPSSAATVASFDAATGARQRPLFDVPGSNRPNPDSVLSLTADRSGRSVLLAEQPATGPAVLRRWSEGDQDPTEIASDVIAAVWVPRG